MILSSPEEIENLNVVVSSRRTLSMSFEHCAGHNALACAKFLRASCDLVFRFKVKGASSKL